MGVPTSEVGYSPTMPRREDHEVYKGHVVALGEKKKPLRLRNRMSVINMRFAKDQRGVILRGQVSTYTKLCFSLNEQHAHHEDSSSKNSVLLHDFCHRVCEAQLIQMAAKFCSFVDYHAYVVNTIVCCASRAKYCLGDFSTPAPTSPSFSISFSKPFARFKTVSLR